MGNFPHLQNYADNRNYVSERRSGYKAWKLCGASLWEHLPPACVRRRIPGHGGGPKALNTFFTTQGIRLDCISFWKFSKLIFPKEATFVAFTHLRWWFQNCVFLKQRTHSWAGGQLRGSVLIWHAWDPGFDPWYHNEQKTFLQCVNFEIMICWNEFIKYCNYVDISKLWNRLERCKQSNTFKPRTEKELFALILSA